jgi:hypothetical protein
MIKWQKENLLAMSRAGFEPTISCDHWISLDIACETDGIPLAQQDRFADLLADSYIIIYRQKWNGVKVNE